LKAKILTTIAILTISGIVFAAERFIPISDGLFYKTLIIEKDSLEKGAPPSKIHVFKIDPSKYKLQVITADQYGLRNLDAKTMADKSGAIITFNGGFFTPEYASLGLLMNDGKVLNKMKWTSWWHIFQVKNGTPNVITKNEFLPEAAIEVAIEAGPRILAGGALIPKLKYSTTERTAIGVTSDRNILVAITDDYAVSLENLGHFLKNLDCIELLNLDGGGSSQLYANVKKFNLLVPGFSLVANGIGVFPR